METELGDSELLPGVLSQLLGRSLALGHVTGDLGEADQLACPVADGAEHYAGPEARAVLAGAPALLLEMAGAGGDLQLASGLARGGLLRGIEAREVLPDDLLRRIAFHALGAGIPAGHSPLGVEQEEGVVLDALDHQAEALLALPELFIDPAALGEIARQLDEALHLAALAVDRRDHHVGPESRTVLAHAPALDLDTSLPCGDLEVLLRPAIRAVFIAVETREALPDDVVGRVPLDPLRARVPGQDDPFGVEKKNRVVLDRVGYGPQLR